MPLKPPEAGGGGGLFDLENGGEMSDSGSFVIPSASARYLLLHQLPNIRLKRTTGY